MKKVILFLGLGALTLVLSACGSPATNSISNNTNFSQEELSDIQVTPPVNNLNETATSPSNQVTNMRTISGQSDLALEYSQARIKTNLGDIIVKFYNEESPVTVNNFLNLAQSGFYNGTKFHRVIKDFMIQGGDPNSKTDDTMSYGTGGPEYRFADEINNRKLVAGSLAMANAGPGTNGSQFFIVTAPETPWLDGMHTNFGEVVSGMDVVKAIEAVETGVRDIPVTPVVVEAVELMK